MCARVTVGHGNDNHGCGEFCSTTHHFTVSSNNYKNNGGGGDDDDDGSDTMAQMKEDTEEQIALLSFDNVKNNSGPDNAPTGCAEDSELAIGTTPNEYGTWLYGRDGWCDGRGVYPWTVDITAQLQKLQQHDADADADNQKNSFTLSYRGLWNGTIPDPSSLQQGAPVMMMQTYIVFYN